MRPPLYGRSRGRLSFGWTGWAIRRLMSLLPLVKIWLWISAMETLGGWRLCGLGQVNRFGFLVFFGISGVVGWLASKGLGGALRGASAGCRRPVGTTSTSSNYFSRLFRKKDGDAVERVPTGLSATDGLNLRQGLTPTFKWRRALRRFRRPLPLCFVALAALVFISGALYAPSNHAGITYRIPRVLQWLAHGRWFWINSENYRLNDRACGIEWQSAPLLLFTHSDRALFLLNFIPFLLLPGLVFSVFMRLGVRPRVAWYWMWLLPTGYNFLLQAGSIANDTAPTVYALAALDFACRARVSRRTDDLALSLLAAALLTGAKASNLLLLLPWMLIVVPLLPLGRIFRLRRSSRREEAPFKLRFTIYDLRFLLAVMVSFLPTALLNVVYCGDWSGLALERPGMAMKNPFVGIWGNGFLLLLDNLVPPFFPAAGWWNQNWLTLLPHAISAPLTANFEAGSHMLWELPAEDWSGIGFGLSWLAIISVIAAWRRGGGDLNRAQSSSSSSPIFWAWIRGRGRGEGGRGGQVAQTAETSAAGATPSATSVQLPPKLLFWVLLAPWAALLGYCVESGMSTVARLISPYYPLLLPLLLTGARQAEIVRSRWVRGVACGVVVLSLSVLILTPARPLLPARAILSRLAPVKPENRLLARAAKGPSVYARRSHPMA